MAIRLCLEKLLKTRGWSKNQLAGALGMKQPMVRRYFRPDYDPLLSTINKLAEKLEVPAVSLLEEAKEKPKRSNGKQKR